MAKIQPKLDKIITDPDYRVDGGVLVHDGTRFLQGWNDTFNQSRSFPADGWTENEAGGATVTEDGTDLTISLVNGTQAEWYSGTYNAPYLRRSLLSRPQIVGIYYEVPNAQVGIALNLRFGDTDADFVQMIVLGATSVLQFRRGTATGATSFSGNRTGWVGLMIANGYVRGLYSTNAVGSPPGRDDWSHEANNQFDFFAADWAYDNITLDIVGLNYGANPGGDVMASKFIQDLL